MSTSERDRALEDAATLADSFEQDMGHGVPTQIAAAIRALKLGLTIEHKCEDELKATIWMLEQDRGKISWLETELRATQAERQKAQRACEQMGTRISLLEEVVEESRQRMLGSSPAIKALRDKANKALAGGG